MGRLAPARRVASQLLAEQRRRDARARDLLRTSGRMDGLDERDRALATRLVLGVVACSGRLDEAIGSHLSHGSHLEPRVRDALRVSCLELLYLRTPSAVAVSQGVELVRAANPRAAGLANAVLRRVTREDVPRVEDARSRLAGGTPAAGDIALAAGWPQWLADELVASCGMGAACALALRALEPAGPYVAGDALRNDPSQTEELLRGARLSPRKTPLPGSWILSSPAGLASSGLVETCDALPCDLASQTVAWLCSPDPGSSLLEVGQGRGTKTVLLQSAAAQRGGMARVSAVEVDQAKVRLARSRMERAGISGQTRCVCWDARELDGGSLPSALSGEFDRVFVDAPCSGTGTMRRHPETAWALEPASVRDALPATQLAILSAAAARVRVGGTLCYATCSLLREEDEAVVDAFLSSDGAGFSPVDPRTLGGYESLPANARELVDSMATDDATIRTARADSEALPLDGHFLAAFRRVR